MIDNPILNRPYDEPTRHFAFDDEGITDRIEDSRRSSSYFVPVPRLRKGTRQLELAELTADQIRLNELVNRIREHVTRWRHAGYLRVTPTTRRLLEHWADPERENRVLFCQREAAETAIYLAEVALRDTDVWMCNALAQANSEHNDGLPRVALKMATGSGKTVVMAMLIAWQVLNKVVAPQDKRFTKRFLVVTPGLMIRDRLRVLLPGDPDNYYRLRDLVPAELHSGLGQAQIVVTNYHAFLVRESGPTRSAAATTKDMLTARVGGRASLLETEAQVVRRVLRDLAAGAAPAQKHTVDQQERRPIESRGNADDETIISYGGVPARSRRTFPTGPPALGTQAPERLGDLPARRRYRRALHVPGGSRPDRYEDRDHVPPQRGTRECPRGEPLLLDRPGCRIPHPLPSVPCRAHHRRDGAPCVRWAIRGATVCPSHGGNAPQVRRVAGEREAIDRAQG
ncbi:MAG: DEAD/DEAH box helicase family protein [Pseudonocardiaceae bacterium]